MAHSCLVNILERVSAEFLKCTSEEASQVSEKQSTGALNDKELDLDDEELDVESSGEYSDALIKLFVMVLIFGSFLAVLFVVVFGFTR